MEKIKLNIETFGQVFTPKDIVNKMFSLMRNKGNILEPSCGDGAFSKKRHCTAIELDERVAPKNALIMDFFDFPLTKKFSTIIGNPPYVKFQDISPKTLKKIKSHMFDKRTNLNLFFIEKCIKHLKKNGELIFIVPREFMKSTSAMKLNE
jgi:adenine-specific DNA-methyltransferase